MNKKLLKLSFLQSFGIFAYITTIATIMRNGSRIFGEQDNFFSPVAFLSLFVLSACVTSGLALGRSILWYLDGQKKEAVSLFFYVVGWMFVFTLLAFTLLTVVAKFVK